MTASLHSSSARTVLVLCVRLLAAGALRTARRRPGWVRRLRRVVEHEEDGSRRPTWITRSSFRSSTAEQHERPAGA